ncbi:hypothetical protein RXV86_10760 [Alisedimentitalea sp. MJ-SS2]|nr:hypothetical protein [Alisedimentitalea sp. MJ-SS2]MDU8927864.1 hypothetical protein [Alisedimentitalea sp. MJ-SS2]
MQLGSCRVRWVEDEVYNLLEERILARNNA